MNGDNQPTKRSWGNKFADAFRGIGVGVRGQSSFAVHVVIGLAVIATAAFLQVDLYAWCILLLCIALVLTAEMFNSALEWLAKVVEPRQNPQLGTALDIASGAVLVASLGAAVVGTVVLVAQLVG